MEGVSFNNDKKFDFQLDKGQLAERQLAAIITELGTKVEVKRESYHWQRTGNIAIEYEYRGKPSGILTTEAEWWAHCLVNSSEEMVAVLLIPTKILRGIARDTLERGAVIGGDDNMSRMVLIDLNRVMDKLTQI